MKKIWIVALAVFCLGMIMDLATTYHGMNNGFFETRIFSNQLRPFLLFTLGLFILVKLRPDFLDKAFMVFCLSFGFVFAFAGIHNLMLIIGG